MKDKLEIAIYVTAFLALTLLVTFTMMPLSDASSDFSTIKQNKNFTLTVQSNNATQCNLSSIDYPSGASTIFNTIMTKDGQTFYTNINSSNYNSLGDICHNIICTDGLTYEPGSVCRNISPSGFSDNLGFYIILIVIVGSVMVIGFAFKEEWFVMISGMLLVMVGIYSINYGVAGFRDMFMTWGIGLLEPFLFPYYLFLPP